MKIHKILGPPGTGKTTTLGHILRAKQDISGVVALSFTVAAKWALLKQVRGLDKSQVSTIHSMAYRSLGLNGDNIMLPGAVASFFRGQGFQYSADESRPGNKAEMAISKAIHLCTNYRGATAWDRTENALRDTYDAKKSQLHIAPAALLALARRYWQNQVSKDRFDYNGMLLHCLDRGGLNIAGTDLILDEAQDLTPLMIHLLTNRWSHFDNIYVVGDDDQAIFSFAGSDPEFLFEVSELAHTHKTLATSYRLPRCIHALSQEYIRTNPARIDKEFKPADRDGNLHHCTTVQRAIDDGHTEHTHIDRDTGKDTPDTVLFLCRMRHRIAEISAMLDSAAIVHSTLDTDPPTPPAAVTRILNTQYAITHGGYITPEEWLSTLRHIKRSALQGLPSTAEIGRMLPMASDVKNLAHMRPILDHIAALPPSAFRNSRTVAKWAPLWRGRKEPPEPKVRIGTIHQSKGLQANTVIVDDFMSSRIHDALTTPDEIRVWYVAITRASDRLVFCGDTHKPLIELINKNIKKTSKKLLTPSSGLLL